MSGDKVEILLDGQDAGVVRAWLAAKASVDSFENSLMKIDPIQKKNEASAREYEKTARQAFEATRTPLERYYSAFQKLSDAYEAGKVDVDTYSRRLAQLQQQLADEDGTTAKRIAAEKAAAEAAKQAAAEKVKAENEVLASKEAAAARQEQLERQQASRSLAAQKAAALEQERLEQQRAARMLAAQKAMFLEGQRITESTATAQERHNIRLNRYRELLRAGAVDQNTFNRAVKASRQEMDESGTAIERTAGRIVNLAAGYVSLTAVVGAYKRASQEAQEAAEKAADKQDEVARRFRVQAGLTAIQGEEARKQINQVAEGTGSTSESAFGAATALASTGFEAKEAQGPALRAALELIQAQQLKGKDVSADDLAEAASKYLASQGKEKTGANLRELAIAIQGLKETPMKITDLEQLAKQGATLKGKIGYKEQIANFAMLLESMDAEKAGTSLREVALHLSTAGGAKDKTKALKTIGLRPEDVDLVGESFEEALGKIEGGLQKVPESKRAALLKTLFEGANIAAYELLAQNQDKVKRYVGQEGDVAGFEADVEVGSTGRNAAKRRLQVQKEAMDAETGVETQYENTRTAYQNVLKEKGVGVFSRTMKDLEYQTLTALGVTPENAVRFTAPTKDDFGTNEDYANAVRNRVTEANDPAAARRQELEALKEAAAAMREAANAQKAPTQVDVKVNGSVAPSKVTPPKPRPAAALGGGG